MDEIVTRWSRRGLWLLPSYGVLTLIGTWTHQPDPTTDLRGWSEYVTTGWFYASHLVSSILGLALGTLGVIALGLLLAAARRPRAALTAVVLQVLGSAVVLAVFGVAAFAQPAIGAAFLDGEAAARGWYDAVYDTATLVPAVVGLLAFSSASVVMAWAARGDDRVPVWAAVTYGVTGPLIGLLGLVLGSLQTVGSLALIVSGLLFAIRLGRAAGRPVASPEPDASTRRGE